MLSFKKKEDKDDSMAIKRKEKKYWVKDVKTTAVDVPPKTMTKSPEEIAAILLRQNRSKGPGSINRFIQFYINRAGKSMPKEKVKKLKRAQEIIKKQSRKKLR